jgi:hypothetical protein
VRATIVTHRIYPEPVVVRGNEILVDFLNRGGSDPKIQYVHQGPATDFHVDGYDPEKPQIGVLIMKGDPVRWEKVLKHNKRFSAQSDLYPKIDEELAKYSCAISLRLYIEGKKSSITGLHYTIDGSNDDDLKYAVNKGHRYWILSDKTPDADIRLVSRYRNSDQDRNLTTDPATSV